MDGQETPLKTHRLRAIQRLLGCFHARFPVYAHATDGLEACVGQDEDSSVVGFQVVDLFAEEKGPEVFADEFDAVEGRCWAGAVGAESALLLVWVLEWVCCFWLGFLLPGPVYIPFYKSLPNSIPQPIQAPKHRIPRLLIHPSRRSIICRRTAHRSNIRTRRSSSFTPRLSPSCSSYFCSTRCVSIC